MNLTLHEVDALIAHWGRLAIENGTDRHTNIGYEATQTIGNRLVELGKMRNAMYAAISEARAAHDRSAVTTEASQ